MPDDRSSPHPTLALNTKVEEDFVAPLTAVRGALEILRDFPDVAEDERQRFVGTALRGCAKLEQAIQELAETVYAAGQKAHAEAPSDDASPQDAKYRDRIVIHDDSETIEIDFSDFEFTSSQIVNDFYDVIDGMIEATGGAWYFIVNYRNCSIWPEAWVAFAHRGKKVNVNHSLGTVRYASRQDDSDKTTEQTRHDSFDPNLFTSREAAMAKIDEMKASKGR